MYRLARQSTVKLSPATTVTGDAGAWSKPSFTSVRVNHHNLYQHQPHRCVVTSDHDKHTDNEQQALLAQRYKIMHWTLSANFNYFLINSLAMILDTEPVT